MRKEIIGLSDYEGNFIEKEVELLTKQEVITKFGTKSDKYDMELYGPRCYKYNSDLLDDDSLYFLDDNTITLYFE